MGGLFRFLYRIRVFLLFLGLEGLAFVLIVKENTFQQLEWIQKATALTGQIDEYRSSVRNYFALYRMNDQLASENARLQQELSRYRGVVSQKTLDTLSDPTMEAYDYTVARVVNNSVSRLDNYLTLNRGSLDGIQPGMGVICPQGVVGKVKAVTEHYSTVYSALHSKMIVSATLARTGAFGGVKWPGSNPKRAQLQDIARHIKPKVGDTVLTSEYSTVFPPGIMVGRIRSYAINENDPFYQIEVDLSTDYNTLSYVYVIRNRLVAERDSLEKQNVSTTPSAQASSPKR